MSDEHDLHGDLTPAVAGSLQHLKFQHDQRGAQPTREKKMRRAFAIAIATAVVLASLGAVLANKHATDQRAGVAGTPTTGVSGAGTNIDTRRAELLRRIDQARNAGQLRGVGYMALLSEHQSALVAQRRAEAQGMTDTAVNQLNASLDRIEANLERHLRNN
jgi:hypothetical protein